MDWEMVEEVEEFKRIEKWWRKFEELGRGSERINGWKLKIIMWGGSGNEVVDMEKEEKSEEEKSWKIVRIKCREILEVEKI